MELKHGVYKFVGEDGAQFQVFLDGKCEFGFQDEEDAEEYFRTQTICGCEETSGEDWPNLTRYVCPACQRQNQKSNEPNARRLAEALRFGRSSK